MPQAGVRLHDRALNFVTAEETIRPLRDGLIIRPLPPDHSRTVATDWRGEPLRGVVIAAGPGCYPHLHARGIKDGKPYHTIRQSRSFRATEVKVGELVELGGLELGGYLWPKVWVDDEWCVICREQDVAIVHENDSDLSAKPRAA